MKFTKEEISLCKQVTERHRRDIEYGDWFLNEGGFAKVWPYRHNCKRIDVIPIWTISDCLEFLAERGLWIIGLEQDEDEFSFGFSETDDLGMRTIEVKHRWTDGKTVLEACLKAVLAVLE